MELNTRRRLVKKLLREQLESGIAGFLEIGKTNP